MTHDPASLPRSPSDAFITFYTLLLGLGVAALLTGFAGVKDLVERLMGKDPAHRFQFIQSHAASVVEDEINA